MLQMNLIDTKSKTDNDTSTTRITFEVGSYKLNIDTTIYLNKDLANFVSLSVIKDYSKKWMPEIYINQECMKNEVKDIKIQTTSYGSLEVEDVDKMVEGLQEAKEVVETLKDFFKLV